MRAVALLLCLAACGEAEPFEMVAVTFNTGTTEGLAHDRPPDDGYDQALANISDEHYGDGLAWDVAVDAAQRFFDEHQPDVVAFQEIFWSGDCANIPVEAHPNFVCDGWSSGDPSVAQTILGDDYAVACHPMKPDKCLAVKKAFGTMARCTTGLCLDALDGDGVEGCGRGARVASTVVTQPDGTEFELVNVHGSSGLSDEDVACRVAQFEQTFADRAERTVVLGDLNTDPLRFYADDASARTFRDRSQSAGFTFVTEVGEDAPPTYAGIVNIDHVLTNFASGDCWFAGDDDHPPVTDAVYFDHRPIVCAVRSTP